jgi:ribosomal-protein-alanine N-acetyltransferase
MNMGNNAGLPTLETERLLLRAINENDAEDIYEYSSDEEVSKYMPWKAHQSIEDSITYVKSVIQRYEDKQPSDWGVILKESGKLIGVCGFVSLKPRQKTAKIAYTISRIGGKV